MNLSKENMIPLVTNLHVMMSWISRNHINYIDLIVSLFLSLNLTIIILTVNNKIITVPDRDYQLCPTERIMSRVRQSVICYRIKIRYSLYKVVQIRFSRVSRPRGTPKRLFLQSEHFTFVKIEPKQEFELLRGNVNSY